MSCSGGPITPICHTWSITDSFLNPTSSASFAVRPRSFAIEVGPAGQVKFEMCSPRSMYSSYDFECARSQTAFTVAATTRTNQSCHWSGVQPRLAVSVNQTSREASVQSASISHPTVAAPESSTTGAMTPRRSGLRIDPESDISASIRSNRDGGNAETPSIS